MSALTQTVDGEDCTHAANEICIKRGSWTRTKYTYDPNHPYAVDTVTNSSGTIYSATYDADGNMTTRNGYQIQWTPSNLPSSIASANGYSTFNYDPDGQRYYQSAQSTLTGATTYTTYIGGLFEMVYVSSTKTTEYSHNMLADGQIVAVHTIDDNGSASTSYLHYDHLGSVDAITDDQGSVIQTMSFDAFGQRRDPSNWDYDLSQNTIETLKNYTDRGYTDEEELDNVSLVDLNGRVYDPTVGRFISADPTVPDPLFSQAFNRYSYVYNSPLEYSDPSGFCPDKMLCEWLPTGPNGSYEEYTVGSLGGSGDYALTNAPVSPAAVGLINWGSVSLPATDISLPSTPANAASPVSIPGSITGGALSNVSPAPSGNAYGNLPKGETGESNTSGPCIFNSGSCNPYGAGNPWNNGGDDNGLLPASAGCGTACGADWVTGDPDWSSMGGSGKLTAIPSFNPEIDPPGVRDRDAQLNAALQGMPHSQGAASGPMRLPVPIIGTVGTPTPILLPQSPSPTSVPTSSPLAKYAPLTVQTTALPLPPATLSCPVGITPSRSYNPNLGRNMLIGAGVVGGGFAIVGVVAINVVGFPEVEGSEAILFALAGEPITSSAVAGFTAGGLGLPLGFAAGGLATPPACP